MPLYSEKSAGSSPARSLRSAFHARHMATRQSRRDDERELRAWLIRVASVFTQSDAEDLVQSAFVRALEHFGEVPLKRSHYAWFKTVVRHLAIDQLRQRSRWQMTDWETTEPLLASCDSSQGECDNLALIWDVLELCDKSHRQICEMYYVRGHAYAQIAAALAIPIATVGTRLHRARASLAQKFDELRSREAMADDLPYRT